MDILLFGIAKEIVGTPRLNIPEAELPATVGELRQWLHKQYPAFSGLNSLAIAVDSSYANDGDPLHADQEVALIPPVSGG